MSYQEYFGETHNILRQSIRKFLEREVLPYVDEWKDQEEFLRSGSVGLCAGIGSHSIALPPIVARLRTRRSSVQGLNKEAAFAEETLLKVGAKWSKP